MGRSSYLALRLLVRSIPLVPSSEMSTKTRSGLSSATAFMAEAASGTWPHTVEDGMAVNHTAQALAKQRMVINNKDAALFRRRFPHTRLRAGVFSTRFGSSRWRRGPPPRGNSRETGRKRQDTVVPEPGWLCKFKVAPMTRAR